MSAMPPANRPAELDAVLALQRACVDGGEPPPFQDQAIVELRRGERTVLGTGPALAVVREPLADEPAEVELAVDPAARRRGHGSALAASLADRLGSFEAWAHGDLPGARVIATRLGMRPVRTLLQLRAPVPADVAMPEGVRAFAATDAPRVLAVNAAAFATHPEQGAMREADFAARRAETWHEDANLLVAGTAADRVDAFTWIKPAGDVAELYVLGVDPAAQGAGLGRRLLQATFARMRSLGFDTAHLYVEGDNAPALALYRSAGFTQYAIDVRWRLDLATHAPARFARMEP